MKEGAREVKIIEALRAQSEIIVGYMAPEPYGKISRQTDVEWVEKRIKECVDLSNAESREVIRELVEKLRKIEGPIIPNVADVVERERERNFIRQHIAREAIRRVEAFLKDGH